MLFSNSLSPAVEKLKHSANKSGHGGGKNADLQKKSVYLGIGHDYEFYWMRGAFSLVNMCVVLPLFEIASVVVCFNHIARFIVNANHRIMSMRG